MNPHFDDHGSPPSFWRSRYAVGLVLIGGIAVYFLLTEHLAHVVGALPYLLLLACPLMHVFMHRGHGGHHHQARNQSAPSGKADIRKPGDPS
ncbi:DUF2933 domain-containing protein [Pseudomonas sp. BN415]|uniref:DUF2933 domain-containing protein n=1 Tax=Pseudomonas sp. BN415 TaxID=2567889 RepID=UPI0024586AF4|nr:DUF2933 domain-containing protein [Pseudomonas sp. BN415]MDH4583094.1 DUF2933 domain-containing protein [Pseudomonas sp. BN415]